MTSIGWIVIGIIAGAIAAFAIPYGFHLKSIEQSQIDIKGKGSSITQKSSGTKSPNIVIGGEGASLQIIYDTPPKKKQNTHKVENNDK